MKKGHGVKGYFNMHVDDVAYRLQQLSLLIIMIYCQDHNLPFEPSTCLDLAQTHEAGHTLEEGSWRVLRITRNLGNPPIFCLQIMHWIECKLNISKPPPPNKIVIKTRKFHEIDNLMQRSCDIDQKSALLSCSFSRFSNTCRTGPTKNWS